ncbi:hypothetical protein B0A55_08036 [Friedmanniomyces simplex]|uniref:PRKR-interacting protein 1 n=1 Tax=Friedmanniomyces simplex TaxID=329884 RepID=A0A4U0X544_9PEZI|nr:hypothetical protein B0A55_08036 [Friedmanniomyces simplex]
MSEPIPESIPTSSDRRSHRPTKKRALTPVSQQSAQVEALFAHPDRPINLPPSSTSLGKNLAPPLEIVTNVQGSSAGAGSGEFHVYKASRRREYERLRVMDEEVAREEADREFEAKKAEQRRRDEEVSERNRAKREKAKLRAKKGKAGKAGQGGGVVEEGGGNSAGGDGGVKKKLAPRKMDLTERDADGRADGHEAREAMRQDGQASGEDGGGITFHDED